MNKFLFMGRLTRDPELRYTPQGTPVCDIGVALNYRYKDRQSGETKEETTFVDVTFWGRKAEVVCEHFHKGKMIAGEGRLKQDRWEDPTGAKRSRLRVNADTFHFCGDSPSNAKPQSETRAPAAVAPITPVASPGFSAPAAPPPPGAAFSDEAVPF